jgi:hypothetical protein
MKTFKMAIGELLRNGKVNCDGMEPAECIDLANELTKRLKCECSYSGITNEISSPKNIEEYIEYAAARESQAKNKR